MRLTKGQREQIKGMFLGCCAYCGEALGDSWCADHKIAIRRNGDGTCLNPEHDVIENMMPSCNPCNNNKHSMSLEAWRSSLEDLNRKLHDYVGNFRLACKYGLVQSTPKPVVFYFESFEILKELESDSRSRDDDGDEPEQKVKSLAEQFIDLYGYQFAKEAVSGLEHKARYAVYMSVYGGKVTYSMGGYYEAVPIKEVQKLLESGYGDSDG